MRILLGILSLFLFLTACQSTNLGFISSNRKEITVGYLKLIDDTRRAEGSDETDADVSVKASIDFINKSNIFPFKMNLLTITLESADPRNLSTELQKFSTSITKVAAWIASKSTGINLAVAPLTLEKKVPMFFPITSKSLFTQGYPNLYQETPSNSQFGSKTWDLAKSLNIKNLLIIEDSSIIYSGEYVQSFLSMNQIHNSTIATSIISGNWAKDQGKLLDQIRDTMKSHSFDGVYFPGYAKDISTLLGVLETLGIQLPVLTGDEGSDISIFGQNIRGLNKIYYLTYYPSSFSSVDNPKVKSRIEDFNKFNKESGTGSLSNMQLYYTTPLVIGEIINAVLSENPSIPDKDTFYEIFNTTAKTRSLNGLLDRPIQFSRNGTINIQNGDLFVATNGKKEGNQTTGNL